jgi:hypothetical protein
MKNKVREDGPFSLFRTQWSIGYKTEIANTYLLIDNLDFQHSQGLESFLIELLPEKKDHGIVV